MAFMTLTSVVLLSAYCIYGCQAQVIGFSPSNYTVKESDRTLEVTATILDGYIPEGETVNVSVSTEEGSATEGEDYKEIDNYMLTFDNTTVTQTVTVTVFEDGEKEDMESFSLVLSLPEPPRQVAKRFALALNSPIASITINDTSPEGDLIVAIGVGIGIPLALVALQLL